MTTYLSHHGYPLLLAASAAVMRPDQANRSAQELLQLEEAQEWVEAFEARRGIPGRQ